MREYKPYYGEYTLKHWINMILRKEIVLPPFQRDFVWTERKIISLIESIQNKFFIPPVIIGTYSDAVKSKSFNYVLDGQQRLSAIILAYLKKFPIGAEFAGSGEIEFADGNDDYEEEDDDSVKKNVFGWSFGKIQDIDKHNKEELLSELKPESYKDIIWPSNLDSIDDNFFDNNYLGFSYIKPAETDVDKVEQKKYFSSVFRNINISATQLSIIESRSSLYWLDDTYKEFFDPTSFNDIKIDNKKIDFARCLSLLFEKYKKVNGGEEEEKTSSLAYGYGGRSKNMEDYIINFIYHIVRESPSDRFVDFNIVFQDGNYKDRMQNLVRTFSNLGFARTYSSIVDADYYLCGLVYFVFLKNTNIDIGRKDELANELREAIRLVREEGAGIRGHIKTPSALKWMRQRIAGSIKIYAHFLQEEPDE